MRDTSLDFRFYKEDSKNIGLEWKRWSLKEETLVKIYFETFFYAFSLLIIFLKISKLIFNYSYHKY